MVLQQQQEQQPVAVAAVTDQISSEPISSEPAAPHSQDQSGPDDESEDDLGGDLGDDLGGEWALNPPLETSYGGAKEGKSYVVFVDIHSANSFHSKLVAKIDPANRKQRQHVPIAW